MSNWCTERGNEKNDGEVTLEVAVADKISEVKEKKKTNIPLFKNPNKAQEIWKERK